MLVKISSSPGPQCVKYWDLEVRDLGPNGLYLLFRLALNTCIGRMFAVFSSLRLLKLCKERWFVVPRLKAASKSFTKSTFNRWGGGQRDRRCGSET